MTISEAITNAIKMAKKTSHLIYVYDEDTSLCLGKEWHKDWLFKAYPGGRKELSGKGREYVKRIDIEIEFKQISTALTQQIICSEAEGEMN